MGPDRNLAVGLFVMVAILIGIVLTAWITGQRGSEPTQRYHVMIDSDVSGLMLGGPVFFMGVQVGEVTELVIVHGNPAVVRVELNVNAETPVDTGTWATLAAQGITGVSVINLSASPGDHTPLEITMGQELPVIPYRDTGFSALLSSAPAVIEKLDALLDNANRLLNPDNRLAVTQTLANIQQLSDTLAQQADVIARLPRASTEALGDIQKLTRELSKLVDESGPTVSQSLANVESATADLQSLSARLNDLLIRHEKDLSTFSEDGLTQVPALITDTRDALNNLDRLIKSLEREPSRVIFRPVRDEITVKE